MVANLTRDWAAIAQDPGLEYFPETEWAQRAALRTAEDFDDLQRELSGVQDNKRARFNPQSQGHSFGNNSRSAEMQTTMAMMEMNQQAYRQNYHNQVTFNVNGQDIDFAQGDMHEYANERVEQARERLERLRREGASEEEIRRAERNLQDYRDIAELTDPSQGEMTAERRAAVQAIFNRNEDVAQDFAEFGQRRQQANEYADRLESLETLREQGVLQEGEYQQEREALISSVPEALQGDFDDVLESREAREHADGPVTRALPPALQQASPHTGSAASMFAPDSFSQTEGVSAAFNAACAGESCEPAAQDHDVAPDAAAGPQEQGFSFRI